MIFSFYGFTVQGQKFGLRSGFPIVIGDKWNAWVEIQPNNFCALIASRKSCETGGWDNTLQATCNLSHNAVATQVCTRINALLAWYQAFKGLTWVKESVQDSVPFAALGLFAG